MNNKQLRILTGLLLIAIPIIMVGAFTVLQIEFEYPDILRKPTDYVLERFAAGGSGLIAIWYVFMLTGVMFTPVAILMHPLLRRDDTPYLGAATGIGVLAGLVQCLGLLRWVFLVPYLAQTYADPASSPAAREAVVIVFQAFHQYLGVGVGEHLGFLFTSLWSILIGLAMLKSPLFNAWLGWLGVVLGLGILAGVFEPMGAAWAGPVNAISYMIWAVWLVVVGIFVLRSQYAPVRVNAKLVAA